MSGEGANEGANEGAIGRGLVECLRDITGRPEIRLAGGLQRLTGGFDTSVYAFDLENAPADLSGRLVLRLFRSPGDVSRARFEAAVHKAAAAARSLPIPIPRMPVESDGYSILGRPFIVMDFVPGVMLVEALADPAVLAAAPRLLAQVQADLHSLPSTGFVQILTSAGIDPARRSPLKLVDHVRRRVDVRALDELRPLADWLDEHRPTLPENPAICHGDLHPANVMVEGTRVTGVIDWANVVLGHPEFDVACTRLILSIGPMEGPEVHDDGVRELIDKAVDEYLIRYRQHRLLDDALLSFYTVVRAASAFTRVALADARVDAPDAAPDGYAWRHPVLQRALVGAIDRETGLRFSPRWPA